MNASQKPPQTPTTPSIPIPDPSSPDQTTTASSSSPEKSLLNRRFAHLLRPLCPLLSVETGQPHPAFPATLLNYHLLTNAQLDDLAHFYHQRTPGPNSLRYPMPIVSRYWAPAVTPVEQGSVTEEESVDNFFDHVEEEYHDVQMGRVRKILDMTPLEQIRDVATIEDKRRRFGRFLGLQGLESAVSEGDMRAEMERWVEARLARIERREEEREMWRSKRYW